MKNWLLQSTLHIGRQKLSFPSTQLTSFDS
jgi:hypothetical protein